MAKKPKPAKPKAPAKAPAPPKSLQRFEFATVKRSAIALFALNPRSIDKHARAKLRKNLEKNGLVEPLCVNRREDGSLVLLGGHQRLSVADELMGYPATDYDVPVAVTKVSRGQENAIVVALNNPGMQGNWDFDRLEQLLADPETDIEATGFERVDLGLMFDQGVLDGIFGAEAAEQVAADKPIVDMLTSMKDAGRDADRERYRPQTADSGKAPETQGDGAAGGSGDSAQPRTPSTPEAMQKRREAYQERVSDANDAEFFIVLVAEDRQQLARFLERVNWPEGERYFSLREMAGKLDIDIDTA